MKMKTKEIFKWMAVSTGTSEETVKAVVRLLFKEIKDNLARKNKVSFRNFGTFYLQKRAKKMGRVVRHNRPVEIPEHYRPAFKPSRHWIKRVKTKTTQISGEIPGEFDG